VPVTSSWAVAQEQVKAQIVVTQAKAQADAVVAQATAQARATRLAGEAEAATIKAKGDALRDNPALIELTKAERWNGELPTSMIPNTAIPFLQAGPTTTTQ
jgi:regulator of protease activity HflC (stomatin/prohibitin superfamily)